MSWVDVVAAVLGGVSGAFLYNFVTSGRRNRMSQETLEAMRPIRYDWVVGGSRKEEEDDSALP